MPPRPTTQRPPTPTPPPSPNGSILSRAGWSSEPAPLRVVLYGNNRVGKTTLACEFPKPLLLVSFEPNPTGGVESVRGREGVTPVLINSTADGYKLADELTRDTYYKTVVVDSATGYQDIVLREILGLSSLPEQMNFGEVSGDQYRDRSGKTREGLRPFLSLAKHVVVTAKEKDHNPPKEEKVNPRTGKVQPDMRAKFLRGMTQQSYVAPEVGGASVSWLLDCCGCVCRLYLAQVPVEESRQVNMGSAGVVTQTVTVGERVVHRLRTLYHPNFAGGIQAPSGSEVPEYVEGDTPAELYARLMTVIRPTTGGTS